MSGPLRLPAEARAAGLARAHVRRVLAELQVPELTDTAALLVSEVVTNALLHAGSVSSLLVEPTGDGVRVTVADPSPVLPTRRRRSDTAATGRGCQLLTDLADDWGAEVDAGGKQVWFTLSSARDPWAAFDTDALLAEADL